MLDMYLDIVVAVAFVRANHDAPFDDIELIYLHAWPIGLDSLEVVWVVVH